MSKLFTSESVSSGHPDKLSDSISDAILDAYLRQDPDSRVAVETLVTNGLVQIAGEVRSEAVINISDIVRKRIIDVGYDSSVKSFDGNTCAVNIAISEQSPDIAQGVDASLEYKQDNGDKDEYDVLGAGDQGLVFGGAVSENPALLPTPIYLSHLIIKQLEKVRKDTDKAVALELYPDAKTQVTVEYDNNGIPRAVDTVVLSTQHAEEVTLEELRSYIKAEVILPVLTTYNESQKANGYPVLDLSSIRYFINPTGRFVIGGPKGDAGLTGRKIIVDTYGGYFRHGGGAFSGKDYTKVDRSAAYAARWVSKNIVAAGLASKVEVQIAYAIGVSRPVSVYVDTSGTGTVSDDILQEAVDRVFDLRPAAIAEELSLANVSYLPTATGGHFGRESDDKLFTWESTNKTAELNDIVSTLLP